MIDLKVKNGVPNAIEVFGHTYLLETDFRVWLDYPDKIKALVDGNDEGYRSLFTPGWTAPAIREVIEQLDLFYAPESVVPKSSSEKKKAIDFDIDADFIYASFVQAYGIDLTEESLHWHKFCALLSALPSNTMMSAIIGYRLYDGDDKEFKELKDKWELPYEYTEEEKEAMETFEKFFG